MICPQCRRNSAHRSHRTSLQDRFLGLWNVIPYRCGECTRRFYAWRSGENSPRLRTAEERRIMALRRRLKWRKSRIELLAYGLGFSFFIFIIYLVIQQRLFAE